MTEGAANIPAWQSVRAPRGAEISCKGWQQEAALRMLMNSVDRDVAEQPESLTPCAALGKVAADWDTFGAIAASLRDLANDVTLIVQEGKIVGIVPTSADSPRALILDSDPAASWLNVGPQLFLPESYEILGTAKRRYFDDDLRGKLIVAQDMSFVGAALSLATTMHGAAFLGIDADPERIKRYVKTGYCDVMVNNLDEALRILKNAVRKREPASVELTGNPDEIMQELVSRGVVPDWLMGRANFEDEPSTALEDEEPPVEEFGSILLPRNGNASVCCLALSGEPADIRRIDRLLLELFLDDELFARHIRILQRRVRHQGLPARALWLDGKKQSRFGLAVNQLVAKHELSAPMVVARLARSFNTIRASKQVSAIVPAESGLNKQLQLARSATWAAIVHDAERRARVVAAAVVADGSNEASARIERALKT